MWSELAFACVSLVAHTQCFALDIFMNNYDRKPNTTQLCEVLLGWFRLDWTHDGYSTNKNVWCYQPPCRVVWFELSRIYTNVTETFICETDVLKLTPHFGLVTLVRPPRLHRLNHMPLHQHVAGRVISRHIPLCVWALFWQVAYLALASQVLL